MVEAEWRTPASVLQRLGGESLVMAVDEAEKKSQESLKSCRGDWWSLQKTTKGRRSAHLNWQKMSANSAEMLEACSTVTLKVNRLPTFRCSSVASRGPSRHALSGFSSSSAPAVSRNDSGEELRLDCLVWMGLSAGLSVGKHLFFAYNFITSFYIQSKRDQKQKCLVTGCLAFTLQDKSLDLC